MAGGLLTLGKPFQPPAVHDEYIQPSIVIVVIKSNAATCGFQQIFVLPLASKYRLGLESGLASNIDEAHIQRSWLLLQSRRNEWIRNNGSGDA